MEAMAPVALLIITGSMGSGKTTVMGEAADLLTLRGIPHAAIDLDWLRIAHFPSEVHDDGVSDRNLRCVWRNYQALGLTRLLLATALESRSDLKRCCVAVSASEIVVCRLTASLATMQQRVRSRETGVRQQIYVERVLELNAILDRARVEDFTVENENRPVTDVAQEVLRRAGWL
jgi:adenylylsulfate kinase